MRQVSSGPVIALIIITIMPVGVSSAAIPPPGIGGRSMLAQARQTQASPKGPGGSIVVEEEVRPAAIEGPEQHFRSSRDSFLKKDAKAAAAEIRKAAAILREEAGGAAKQSKQALLASARELGRLADGVENGTVKSAKQLEEAFARAYQALAWHHYLKAEDSWAKKATRETGSELRSAADYLERAWAWTGQKVERGTATAIKDAQDVAGKLTEGLGSLPAEYGKAYEALGKAIEKLGKRVESAARP